MSGQAEEADKNRKARRARSRPNLGEQRLASLMSRTAEAMPQDEGEPVNDYFRRLRQRATRVQHEQRAAKRRAARASRKANR